MKKFLLVLATLSILPFSTVHGEWSDTQKIAGLAVIGFVVLGGITYTIYNYNESSSPSTINILPQSQQQEEQKPNVPDKQQSQEKKEPLNLEQPKNNNESKNTPVEQPQDKNVPQVNRPNPTPAQKDITQKLKDALSATQEVLTKPLSKEAIEALYSEV